ncbi:ABC transporter ATP-binding protein [Acrocarpospora pleiomorpha]|uniref:ABC transporter ATP-binding protein n=1 Tax=Acrocarpospora pleiomorpha TaxID=90975 RepID=A0A5M3Y024_9ACTN|nr:ABC transporter ATP-binding protein [Acrocarpospora pleiomorpha]GES25549.1 ABC transporter ATP-binding protein [Acrocarpospora pleiomorpha]
MNGELVIDRLGLRFGGVVALREVSIRHHPDEVLGIIGPNGAGKTSLINAVTGIYPPSSGSVSYRGTPLTGRSPESIVATGIARTFQHNQLCGDLTVRENVLLGCHPRLGYGMGKAALGIGPARRAERRLRGEVEPLLDLLNLADVAAQQAGSLPYGLQKRVEMARALALRPTTLLLDEPAAGTSDEDRAALVRIIKHLREEGSCSVVLIEHDVGLVMEVSDRVAVLDWGECIMVDTPEVVAADARVLAAYLGVDDTPRDLAPSE